MTRKQKAKQERNKKIKEWCKEYCVEDAAAEFHISVPSIYKIIRQK